MKPETILQSDMLDILFENRNKAYGAYSLRKHYNRRLLQSIGITAAIVGLFFVMQSMRFREKNGEALNPVIDSAVLTDVQLKPDEKKKIELPRTSQAPVKSDIYTPPLIVPDNNHPENTMSEQRDLDSATIGTTSTPGAPGNPQILPVTPGNGPVETPIPAPAEPAFDETTVRESADVMPAFSGDIVKYMLRNLHEPDDLEEGQRIVVKVRFVVNRDGDIGNIEVIQSGRPDLDREVMRVVKKMPKWRPGTQGGRPVPVYFNLPVTFVSNGE